MGTNKVWSIAKAGDAEHVLLVGSAMGFGNPAMSEATTVRVEDADFKEVAGELLEHLATGGAGHVQTEQSSIPVLGVVGKSNRGFSAVSFVDSYDAQCSLSQSSVIFDYEDSMGRPGTSAVWLGLQSITPKIMARDAAKYGIEVPNPPVGWVDYPVPPEVLLSSSMHLNREQVAGLIQRLQTWLDTGEFTQGAVQGKG